MTLYVVTCDNRGEALLGRRAPVPTSLLLLTDVGVLQTGLRQKVGLVQALVLDSELFHFNRIGGLRYCHHGGLLAGLLLLLQQFQL